MRELYFYNGSYCTMAMLEQLSGTSRRTIERRLSHGWDIGTAVETPAKGKSQAHFDSLDPGGSIEIRIKETIPRVFPEMQPKLNRVYPAKRCHAGRMKQSEEFCIIMLENGKPLIVYPSEYEIVEHKAA